MRSFRHWTPRYIRDRLRVMYYERNRDAPWLTEQANRILDSYLVPTDVGLETGSGRSTVWFARRIGKLLSIEHDPLWYQRVTSMLDEGDLSKVDYRLYPMDRPEGEGEASAYVNAVKELPSASLDFALVDGVYRQYCAFHLLDRLRPGGLLVIDNVNWYLPHETHSPYSRGPHGGPDGPVWGKIWTEIGAWRSIWTSSGVTDTALFFKPNA